MASPILRLLTEIVYIYLEQISHSDAMQSSKEINRTRFLSGIFILVCFTGVMHAQKSERRRYVKAYNGLDHFTISFDAGVPFPMISWVEYNHSDQSTKHKVGMGIIWPVGYPPVRISGGYVYRRHAFELEYAMIPMVDAADYLAGMYLSSYGGDLDISPAHHIYLGYSFDVLGKTAGFKLKPGGHAGITLCPINSTLRVSPTLAVNLMLEWHTGRRFCLYTDFRFASSLIPLRSVTYYDPYPRQYTAHFRFMAFTWNFGFKVKIYSRENQRRGKEMYDALSQ